MRFLKQVGGSHLLTSGPFAVEYHLNEVTAVWHPALSDILPHLLPHGKYRYDLEMSLQGSESAGRHRALTLEFSCHMGLPLLFW